MTENRKRSHRTAKVMHLLLDSSAVARRGVRILHSVHLRPLHRLTERSQILDWTFQLWLIDSVTCSLSPHRACLCLDRKRDRPLSIATRGFKDHSKDNKPEPLSFDTDNNQISWTLLVVEDSLNPAILHHIGMFSEE